LLSGLPALRPSAFGFLVLFKQSTLRLQGCTAMWL
jgi:hypothetical protein